MCNEKMIPDPALEPSPWNLGERPTREAGGPEELDVRSPGKNVSRRRALLPVLEAEGPSGSCSMETVWAWAREAAWGGGGGGQKS